MTARTNLTIADPLSDVLRMIRLDGAVFMDNYLTAPWCFMSVVEPGDCAPFNLTPRQLVAYHLIVEGRVTVTVPGQAPMTVVAGDAVILPRNTPHFLASDVNVQPVNAANYVLPPDQKGVAKLVLGGGGALTRLYCGFLASADHANPVIAALPPLLTLSMRDHDAFDFVESSMRFAIQELAQGRLASSGTMSRIAELLLVEAVRRFVTDNNKVYGWLDGFRDPQIGRALAALHRDLRRGWTVEDLAKEAAMSRTAFSNRFQDVLGQSPIKYLTSWRLRIAQQMLSDGPDPISVVAEAVGYDSEEAFSRAFKRAFNKPPAMWRNEKSR
jgi:AraC-like DNA-binding protein